MAIGPPFLLPIIMYWMKDTNVITPEEFEGQISDIPDNMDEKSNAPPVTNAIISVTQGHFNAFEAIEQAICNHPEAGTNGCEGTFSGCEDDDVFQHHSRFRHQAGSLPWRYRTKYVGIKYVGRKHVGSKHVGRKNTSPCRPEEDSKADPFG